MWSTTWSTMWSTMWLTTWLTNKIGGIFTWPVPRGDRSSLYVKVVFYLFMYLFASCDKFVPICPKMTFGGPRLKMTFGGPHLKMSFGGPRPKMIFWGPRPKMTFGGPRLKKNFGGTNPRITFGGLHPKMTFWACFFLMWTLTLRSLYVRHVSIFRPRLRSGSRPL